MADCKLTAIDKEGRVKDEYYGEGSGEANRRLAQIALQGMRQYPGMLLEAQDVDKLDAVSGANGRRPKVKSILCGYVISAL